MPKDKVVETRVKRIYRRLREEVVLEGWIGFEKTVAIVLDEELDRLDDRYAKRDHGHPYKSPPRY
jgi:hypothetical protein